ncbi:hypothetical protein BO82DRAFT_356292 [Aspergillus uvarum CBS 121591]|uniref:Uncharacterized protein n=1 Tax=Aspergillus uvarum CBS 121591 TaxID=1448315 RepID=A0A319CLF6_9EURO|nr:hypothetical protein BO82DRAFT_356292 [Aspergillus uvarum CBS 121591]PYH79513.1 hypothetical protein BO82DRAFT_356292 [Aspergillus uvarum CBS 121591]
MAENEKPPPHPLSNTSVRNMAQPSNTTPVPDPMPVNLPGHYVVEHRRTFFCVELNHDEADLIPRRYLEAAEKSSKSLFLLPDR